MNSNQWISQQRKPWLISGFGLPAEILLACKLLLILLLFNGFPGYLQDPHIPFFEILDQLRSPGGWYGIMLKALFIVGSVTLLFNIQVKRSILLLGVILLLFLLGSKPEFRNHIFIIACVYILVGVSPNHFIKKALIIQVALMYFGASLNKSFEPDWWSGQFMHFWMTESRENIPYQLISDLLPNNLFAKILSWSSIIVEGSIAILILFKRTRLWAVWLIVLFHLGMFSMVAFRFGHFVQDLFLLLIVFIEWPKAQISLQETKQNTAGIRILKLLDWDQRLQIVQENDTMSSKKSFLQALIYCNGLYFLLLGFDILIVNLMFSIDSFLTDLLLHAIFCIVAWGLILPFFISFSKNKMKASTF